MLGDADAVAVGDFCDGHAGLNGCVQIDVVGADTGGQRQLELGCSRDPLCGEVGGPEWLRDHDFGVRKVPV